MHKKAHKYLTIFLTLIYLLGFYVFYAQIGNSYILLSIIPLIMLVWFFDIKYALLSQMLFIVNSIVAFKVLNLNYEYLTSVSYILNTLINLFILIGFHFFKVTFNRKKEDAFSIEKYKNRLNSMLSNITDVVGVLNKDALITYKSPNIKELFGWGQDELIGKPAWTAVHTEDLEKVQNSFYTLFETADKTIAIKFRYQHKNGSYKRVLLTAKIKINDSTLNGILINYHDISDIEKAEISIKENEYKYRTLFENSSDVVCMLDNKGNIIDINHAGEKLYGYTKEEFLKMNVSQLRHPVDEVVSKQYFKKLENDGAYDLYEGRILTKSGQTKWIQVNSTAFYKDGIKAGSQDIIRDISEQKIREEELKASNATKTKLFSILSHDLRNPFSAISGFSELIIGKAKKKDWNNVEEFANMIYQSSSQTEKLLSNLLEWSRTQTGSIKCNPETRNLMNLVKGELKNVGTLASQKHVSIESQIKPEQEIFAYINMISTVIRNLITNAIKFTPENGKITVTVRDEINKITISINDNGIGIAKNELAQLFNANFGLSSEGTEHEKGTGLGLLICKEFIDKHQGNIWVESEMGKGSTFNFYVPQKH
ncbi:MAG: PAS domain S-box protein [Salinivirgaceae bacterium]|jgi:two-component system sensor histidine kinase/response regulator|nr:PAS domain S-box protein [Salinivirgaceae bacterium]